MSSRILKVSLLTSYLREVIEADDLLQDVWIEGEVSSFTVAASGHAYFTLKDSQAVIDGVMWKTTRTRQSYAPKAGDQIVAHGSITIYDRSSKYQLKADVVQPAGVGILQLQLEQLRQRLEAEGLFDPSRKRSLPLFPRRIGVVTSPTGAVWHDIQHVIARRYPLAELILSPATVQGATATSSLIAALRAINEIGEVDLIVIARGGGSMEDLWSFNDELLVRAIFSSKRPVVSAIGHETDTTLVDFVADARAPTPSAAAEMIVPDIRELRAYAKELQRRGHRTITAQLTDLRRTTVLMRQRLVRVSPAGEISRQRLELTEIRARIMSAMLHSVERKRHDLELQRRVLHALDPAALLHHGYAFVSIEGDSAPVRNIATLEKDQHIRATFNDGSALAKVLSTRAADPAVTTNRGDHG
ncbi:MAG: exodeoxyribonuclease VII large subunit [Chloroflexota bacterium]|nr:exodeoxyribonuclease VII large subunit [Chloroflexota bacterium]